MSSWQNGEPKLETGRVILCEGGSDKRFFQKLIEIHGLPDFNIPWPWLEGESVQPPENNYHGRNGFKGMLRTITERITLNIEKVQGILIVTDATNNPHESFKNVCNQIREIQKIQKAEKFPIPKKPMQIARGRGKMPSIEIMLMPLDGKGSLETLCVQYLKKHQPKIHQAANAYLTTPPVNISNWSMEKQSKSHLHCMVAGTYEQDPALPIQQSFSRKHHLIDLTDPLFHPIRDQIKSFATALP